MGLVPYVHLDASLDGAADGDHVALSAADDHHLRRVLRLTPGSPVEVADGGGGSASGVLADGAVEVTAVHPPLPPRTPRLTVLQALPKARKFDEVVRQVTELGADAIVPVAAARSVTQLDGARATKAVERWRAVARAAGEQSRSPHRPVIGEVTALADLLDRDEVADARIVIAHPGGPPLPEVGIEVARGAHHLAIAVGPEGGWTDAEVARLVAGGAVLAGLGPTVLRTEHAAAAAIAVLAALTGRWQVPDLR